MKRGAWLVPLLLTALLAGCLDAPDSAREELGPAAAGLPLDADGFVDRGFDGIVRKAADIASPVGGTIHAEFYLPAAASADEPVPVILEVTPYNGLDAQHAPFFDGPSRVHRYAERGYAVAFVDTRGFGGSTGCWDYYGDDEMADVVAAVEWFAAQPWSTGKVGMVGTSYPGTTQLLAAIGRPDGLAAIVPVAPEPSVYENQFKNGVQYRNAGITSSAIYATLYPAIALGPPLDGPHALPGYVQGRADTAPCLVESTASLGHPDALYDDYMAERDRQDDAHLVEVPVFWTHGFWDQNVKPDEFVPFWERVDTTKRAWFWHGYHNRPEEGVSGRAAFPDQEHRWLDHFLYGVDNGITELPAVEVQDSLGRWRYEDTWPPDDVAPTKLFPSATRSLTEEPSDNEQVTFATDPQTAFTYRTDGFLPRTDAWLPQGAYVGAATEPLAAPVHIAGTPLFHTTLSIDRTRGQIVTGLFDVAPDDTWTLVVRGALDLRHRDGMDHVVDVVPGETMEVTFDGWPTDWVFDAGHQIAVLFVGTEERFATTDNSHTVTLELGHGTSVELPILGERTEFFDETSSEALEQRERMGPPQGWTR